MEPQTYNHYVTLNESNHIIAAYSDGPMQGRIPENATLITAKGGYQFALGGKQNPPLYDGEVALYKWNGKKALPRTQKEIKTEKEAARIAAQRASKLSELSEACSAAIYAGIEKNGERYSLTIYDQLELFAQKAALDAGALAVPYHADGALCRMYAADEFNPIAEAAMAHIFYHRTYCNHAGAWARRADAAELAAIEYGAPLPPDLAEAMEAVLAASA